MATLWIVHRDPRWREALLAMAGGVDSLVGDPREAAPFEAAPAPRAVLLGVSGDFEAELAFAHRFAPRRAASNWVLLFRPRDAAEVLRLFDALPASHVAIADDAALLRRRLRSALARRPGAPLSARVRWDAISERFARWFGDLEDPALLAVADPARARESLLLRGEPGTGRGLLARYAHAVTEAEPAGAFLAVACGPEADLRALLRAASPEIGSLPSAGPLTVCLENVDRLAPSAQQTLCAWIEGGPPAGLLPASRLRWMATAGADPDDELLLPELERALAGLVVTLPPLRERPGQVEALTAASGRPFTPDALAALRAHPWPGNLRELEAVLRRTLAARRTDPVPREALRFEPAGFGLGFADSPGAAPGRTAAAPAEEIPEPMTRGDDAADGQAEARTEAALEIAQPVVDGDAERAESLRRLSNAIAHEVGNPLVGIRTYASLLPGHFDDPEFRRQFGERVAADTHRIESVLETLHRLGSLPAPAKGPVDLSALAGALLEHERPRIRERRLVVLEELERRAPFVQGDAEQLRFALGLLIGQALDFVPPRGDLYVTTRHEPASPTREARVALVLRFRAPHGEGVGFGENTLAVAAADAVARSQEGRLLVERAGEDEIGVRLELPAAATSR